MTNTKIGSKRTVVASFGSNSGRSLDANGLHTQVRAALLLRGRTAKPRIPILRILHAYKVYRPDIDGGIPGVIASLVRDQDSGFQQSILTARLSGMARRFEIDGVSVEAVSSLGTLFSTPLAPGYFQALRRLSRTADLVIHHAPLPLTDLGLLSGLPDHVALIVYWHADIVGFKLLKRLVSPAIIRSLKRADRIVVSDASIISHSDTLRPFASKCVVVPYGVDVEYWGHQDSRSAEASASLRQRYPRMVLSIGRLVPYKGLDVLIRALAETDAQGMIVGEGPLRPQLERLAAELGVSDRVTFAGRLSRDEIKTMIYAAKLLAFPSVTRAEAFGIVQLEAMTAALPVINTDLTTAVPSIARHQREGLTVPVGDSEALAAAMRRILDDPALARSLGDAARERALTEYSEAGFVARIKQVYREAVQHRMSELSTSGGNAIAGRRRP